MQSASLAHLPAAALSATSAGDDDGEAYSYYSSSEYDAPSTVDGGSSAEPTDRPPLEGAVVGWLRARAADLARAAEDMRRQAEAPAEPRGILFTPRETALQGWRPRPTAPYFPHIASQQPSRARHLASPPTHPASDHATILCARVRRCRLSAAVPAALARGRDRLHPVARTRRVEGEPSHSDGAVRPCDPTGDAYLRCPPAPHRRCLS